MFGGGESVDDEAANLIFLFDSPDAGRHKVIDLHVEPPPESCGANDRVSEVEVLCGLGGGLLDDRSVRRAERPPSAREWLVVRA